MFKITIEDLDGEREKQVIIAGEHFAIFCQDPNKEDTSFSTVSASPAFMMSVKDAISDIVLQSVTGKKCDSCAKKGKCSSTCETHTVDLDNVPPELKKEMDELVEYLKSSGYDGKAVDMTEVPAEIRDKMFKIIKAIKKSPNVFSSVVETILKNRSKNPFH